MPEKQDNDSTQRVKIADKTREDYDTYQLKNHPNTNDFAVTVVMGCPFSVPFIQELENLCDGLKKIFSPFPYVTLHMYQGYHFHATVCPAIRTTFKKEKYKQDREKMNHRQQIEIEDRGLHYDLIEKAVVQSRPFGIQITSGKIEINGRGEILLWGKAKTLEDEEQLKGLRKRLVEMAGLDGRDKGSKIHITLSIIEDFHRLMPQDKEIIAKRIDELLRTTELGTTYVDRVRFVYYAHRSLRRVVSYRDLLFRWY